MTFTVTTPEDLRRILQQAKDRGYEDGLADYPYSDTSDVADFIADAVDSLSRPTTDDKVAWETYRKESAAATSAVIQAYATGFGQGQVEMREAITLEEAAQRYPLAYSSLAQAVREGRLAARRSGKTWLTSPATIEQAITAGKLRPRIQEVPFDLVRHGGEWWADLGTGDLARAAAALLEARHGGHHEVRPNGHVLYYNGAADEPTGDVFSHMIGTL
jgi:hypothetical protein